MRAVNIVGTLCNIETMTKDDIGIINIVDISIQHTTHAETVVKIVKK